MDELEDSMKRHPAGMLRKKAEESPHSLGWALGMAKVLGERGERERIIKLLEPIRQRNQGKGLEEEIVADILGEVIALIKGENK